MLSENYSNLIRSVYRQMQIYFQLLRIRSVIRQMQIYFREIEEFHSTKFLSIPKFKLLFPSKSKN